MGRSASLWRIAAMALVGLIAVPAAAQNAPLPELVTKDGKHALMVDGAPYLILGAQAHNSSNYPAALPRVWPVVERLHANTLEIPVAWEQIEPVEGQFDFSYLDALLADARERDVRLVLLWFATWKNTGPAYVPHWVKTDNQRFPRMRTREGEPHYVLSPHARSTLEADKRAFVELMRYLKANDPQHTVIMVQPQNEVGSYGQPRDFSSEANKLFAQQIPAELARQTSRKGTWSEAFGKAADTAFNAWYTARYIDEIAAAGQAVKDLPMFCNAALSDAFAKFGEGGGASGGPDWQMIDVWKAAAPHIDFVAPDIYNRNPEAYVQYLDHYARPDNALMIPETGNAAEYARFFWAALGKGAIGFAPFGMDATGYSNYPLGAKELDEATIEAFASKYRLFHPIASDWARVAFRHPLWSVVKGSDAADQSTVMGRWKITAQFDLWQFGERDWTWIEMDPAPTKDKPVGGVVVAQIAPDTFLVAGQHVRMRFAADTLPQDEHGLMLRVEEGTFDEDGEWVMQRVWNGDQVDWGINFTDRPVLLKVQMGTYRG